MKYDAAISRCDEYTYEKCLASLNEVLSATEGINKIKSGDKVVIKANLVSAMKPEKAATVHPVLLCALTDILVAKGASVVIGDSPGGVYNAVHLNRIYGVTGVKAAEEHGAVLNRNFEEAKAEYPEAVTAKEFFYTKYLDDADHIINFCKLKTHGMMGMSAGIKNMFGAVPGIVKPEYHYKYPKKEDFASMIIDLNEYFKPCLTICDAVVGMEGNGPTAGKPRHIGAVIASDSPYKLDTLCAHIIGVDRDDIPTLSEAYKRALTAASHKELNVYGEYESLVIGDYERLLSNRSFLFGSDSKTAFGRAVGKSLKKVLEAKPDVKKKSCVGCGECFRICPAKAITMKNNKPEIDRAKCIKCFCCQEFCPKGAMHVKRTLIARVFTRDK